MRQDCPLSPLLFNIELEVLKEQLSKKRIKSHPDWKGKVKMSLFTDDMILHKENFKDSTKNQN